MASGAETREWADEDDEALIRLEQQWRGKRQRGLGPNWAEIGKAMGRLQKDVNHRSTRHIKNEIEMGMLAPRRERDAHVQVTGACCRRTSSCW
jgi:hypothetical protein